jgi:secondary thiamine-phosphate synthase enzyme
MIAQSTLRLNPKGRGVHLITSEIKSSLPPLPKSGIVNIFLKHTSCSLAINENYDPDVRIDIESFLRYLIPDGWSGFRHTLEGADDMPAHLKNIFIGSSLTIPIIDYSLGLGTWQGVYLLEHREFGGSRELIITVCGE